MIRHNTSIETLNNEIKVKNNSKDKTSVIDTKDPSEITRETFWQPSEEPNGFSDISDQKPVQH